MRLSAQCTYIDTTIAADPLKAAVILPSTRYDFIQFDLSKKRSQQLDHIDITIIAHVISAWSNLRPSYKPYYTVL
ncbi:hypothetical protein J6590_088623 [Homalodisca vitripennis]|nr:hypothetical protein J6590_088623 [Homalodisca vitripennis]